MKNNITYLSRFMAIFIVAVMVVLPSGFAHADAWDWDYSGDWGNTYDYSGDWGSTYDYSGDWGNNYDYSGDWGNNYDYSGDWGSTYDYSGDWGNTYDYSGDWGSNYTYDSYDTYTYTTPSYSYDYASYSYGYPSYGYGSYYYPTYTYPKTKSKTYYTYNTYQYPTYTYPTTPVTQAPVCNLSVNPSRIQDGDTATLSWSNSNASRMYIEDSRGNRVTESTSLSGSYTVSPSRNTTYTMTVVGTDGTTTNCSRTLTVDDEERDYDNAPVCSLRVSDSIVRRGTPVLLTWDNTRAREMTIRDQYSNQIFYADGSTSRSADYGRETVIPNQNVTYTLRVTNSSGFDTCSVSVSVTDGGGSITVDRVPLSDIPYTGFDAGPFLTTLFYLLLGAWAVAIAYYVVRSKYGIPLEETAVQAAYNHAVATEADTVKMQETVTTSTVAFPTNLPTDDSFTELFTSAPTQEDETFSLTTYAANERIFITDEVVSVITQSAQTPFARKAYFDALIAKARAQYPTEHGWLTIDSTRLAEISE